MNNVQIISTFIYKKKKPVNPRISDVFPNRGIRTRRYSNIILNVYVYIKARRPRNAIYYTVEPSR